MIESMWRSAIKTETVFSKTIYDEKYDGYFSRLFSYRRQKSSSDVNDSGAVESHYSVLGGHQKWLSHDT